MIKKLIQSMAFALSKRPTIKHRESMKKRVLKADKDRASGAMSAFSRGSAPLQLEEAYTGSDEATLTDKGLIQCVEEYSHPSVSQWCGVIEPWE